MLGFTMPASFQNIEESGEIGVEIGVGILQRVAHPRLRGEMNDVRKRPAVKNRARRISVGEVAAISGIAGENIKMRLHRARKRMYGVLSRLVNTEIKIS